MASDRLSTADVFKALSAGKITRRDAVMLLAMAGMGGSALTGLSSPVRAAATPKSGGHMRFAMAHGEVADTLDPGHVNNGYTTVIAYAMTNTLTEVATDGSLVPKLAESWEASEGASKWVFRIRKGVEFHNGKTLTAKDVVASINHHRRPDSTSSAKPIVSSIVSIEPDGGNAVVIKLESGDADIPFKFSTFSFGIYPANEDGSLNWQGMIGAGAYKLTKFVPGERAEFIKNPNYWLTDRGFFDSGELLSVKDVTARQNALLAGEVDGIDRLDLSTLGEFGKSPGIKVDEVSGKLHYTFPMLTNTAPFSDNNVRLALKHAIDREAMLEAILFGHGVLGNDQPITSAYPFFAADIEQRTYDLDKARFYLKQAGMETLDVKLSAANAAFTRATDAALIYQQSAEKAGIKINVEREPDDGYWTNIWQKKPWCAAYWFGTPTPDDILTQAYSGGASWNDTAWNNERFNTVLKQARSELDQTKRAEMYRELQLLVRDEGGAVIPLFANDVFATSDKVAHGKLANNYEVDGRMFFDRWWFA
ncbi:ABC transporter substrate-binding protein [Aestuariivirga sp.]|uniref:ABC transporter substrate-binding protein n=1 Tax=Aestuariivirga sp. TaxID=2650926 RepID=UPI003BAA3094